MQLDDLTQEEQVALGGLLRMMIRSDGDFSEEEESTVEALGEKIAGDGARMWRVISASAQACPHDEAIRESARGVTRPEARALIRDALQTVAAGDEVVDSERALLAWLDGEWG